MLLAQVIAAVVSTQKHQALVGSKLLLVQPVTPDGQFRGNPLLAVDGVGAGVSERVLIVLEGRAAGEAIGRRGAPVDAAVIGIVDRVDVAE
jgi:ethanolamine utilization protein EutN